jgi:hypothetical protein
MLWNHLLIRTRYLFGYEQITAWILRRSAEVLFCSIPGHPRQAQRTFLTTDLGESIRYQDAFCGTSQVPVIARAIQHNCLPKTLAHLQYPDANSLRITVMKIFTAAGMNKLTSPCRPTIAIQVNNVNFGRVRCDAVLQNLETLVHKCKENPAYDCIRT